MTAFSSFAAAPRPALRTVTLEPTAFADMWSDRPNETRIIGLRIVSDGAIEAARAEGQRRADEMHPGRGPDDAVWVEAYNSALMRAAVAAAVCNPEDVTQDLWPMQASIVPIALTSSAIERLYDELTMLEIITSCASPEASNEDLARLSALLANSSWADGLRSGDERVARRQLAAVLEQLAS